MFFKHTADCKSVFTSSFLVRAACNFPHIFHRLLRRPFPKPPYFCAVCDVALANCHCPQNLQCFLSFRNSAVARQGQWPSLCSVPSWTNPEGHYTGFMHRTIYCFSSWRFGVPGAGTPQHAAGNGWPCLPNLLCINNAKKRGFKSFAPQLRHSAYLLATHRPF